ncbi:transcriptional regulator with XRE-family HTH domain [Alkalihalobacillus xiaoxiensis]|uniref:Transcriptional regulator with XRE-family HTH domain n=1 Tax=Shouchella xiaoxiensis TaxID=766895 RepID=A0ABS2SPY1_9BACI|nr:helix-turn-helix transcriptional regulator [Shouchella xiaoxiensis]MBM7837305.1 transcriptional regulator with XRE-family HTH domain [Shouchella xiaoxiensis]
MESLGSRIRALRKQQGKTLADLAGERLTKGMLSLIENDKAQPSMESLHYIAETLGVEKSELLEEVSIRQLRELLDIGRQAYDEEKYELVEELLQPIIRQNMPLAYESAQLIELYGLTLYSQKNSEWERYMIEAEDRFLQMNQFNEGFRLVLERVSFHTAHYQFDEAIKLLEAKKQFYQSQRFELELMNELRSNYLEIGLLFLTENIQAGKELLQKTIAYSTEKQLFYKMDEYYRVAVMFSTPTDNRTDIMYYVEKHGQLAQLLDSNQLHALTHLLRGFVMSQFDRDYELAIKELETGITYLNESYSLNFFHTEIGACYYKLERYEQALEVLPDLEFVLGGFHGLDISHIYAADAYIARSHLALNHLEKAKFHAIRVKERFDALQYPEKTMKAFVLETYSLICKES